MDAPISPFDGTILKLPGKLDGLLLHHGCNLPKGVTDEILLIKDDLEKIIAIISNLENHHGMMARCWRKEVRELSYDLEDFVDQYEHAVQRIQRWGGRYSSPPYRRLAQEGPPKPTLQFWPWMKEWKIASNKKERNKRMRERKNKTKDEVDEPLLSSSPASTCYRKIKSKAALPWLREKLRLRLWMANEIREFSVRVQEALQRHSSYNLDTIDGSSSTRTTDAYPASGNSMCKEENTYVGIRAALEKLEELLMKKHDHRHQKLKIVSIVGFGGIGKTTLATEFYRKFALQFECRAFVRTAQKPDVRRIFISMLSQVRPHHPPDNWTVHGLISTIRTHLQDKRYLIIVEDLSATSTWDIVKCALPDSNCCSRILTTTEIEDVALQSCGHDPKHVYEMKPLSEENSRELFFSSVFGPQHECPPELKEISYDIISKCGGLPLAIVTVASILSSQLATQDQWHYVNNSIGYNLLTNHSLEGMKQVLNLSYNNLPHHLKACILYTCLYEEDIIIYRDDLVNQWIAEGFIQATEGQDNKEIARSFFDGLISRKLILPVDINRNGEVLSCTVHHMVLNLIRYKSTEENFVTAIHHSQAPTAIADNVRRLSLQFGTAADAKVPVNVTLTHVRTLAIWGFFKCLPSVVQFPLLQVLILHFWGNKDSISFDITGISELHRLRYLKVTSNVILKLCTKMRSMQSLETLTIDARVSAVPSDIVHLPGLLNLSLPAETDLPNGIGNMTSLRMLGYFDLSSNSMENVQSLRMLTNIEDLQLTCYTAEPDNLREKMHFVLNSIFVALRNLKSLTVVPRASSYAKSIDDAGAAGTTISVGFLPSAPALLQCLEVSPRICRFFCLPKWIGQFHKLCVLKFGVRKIDRDGVDILGGLPDLAVLSLYVHIKPEMGIVIGKTGFPVTKYFKFKCCDPCLKFEEGAMPNLRKLKLAFNACNAGQQSTIPVGINYLSELKEVSAKIGGGGPEESHTRDAKSAFRDAIRMHDRIQRVNIQCVKQIIFCNDDQSNITPVEDSPRSGEETMHFQNESKQRKEEEAGEVFDVCASHGAMGLYELSDSGCGSNSEDNWVVLRSSCTSAYFGVDRKPPTIKLGANKERKGEVMEAAVVSASHGAMGSLIAKLGDLLTAEYKLLKEAKGQILFLKAELESMHVFLKKISNTEHPDEQDKHWAKEVRELSYDIEDSVSEFMLKSSSKPHRFKGFINRSMKLLTTMNIRHEITKEFEGLKAHVIEVRERRMRYQQTNDVVSRTTNTTIDLRLLAMYAEASGLVGMDGPRDELIQLMGGEDELKVLSIVGFGGLGKTTLANEIYRKLQGDFSCRAFVSVSQKPNIRKLLRTMLSQVGFVAPKDTNMEIWEESELISELREFLLEQRYLIIIDDIREASAWDIIRCALPKNTNGSRVLVTTRNETVARACCAKNIECVYKMKALSDQDSRSLFFKRIFGAEKACPPYLMEVSAQILKKCGGLPLAIITTSSLIASQPSKLKEHWEHVRDSLGSSFEVSPSLDGMRQILNLSYITLPSYLKTCILYLGIYPEDYTIGKNDLVRQWIAEGFICKVRGIELEDVAKSYFNELINRSLIQPAHTNYNGEVMSCRVHDMMLDLILHKSREENFVTVIDDIRHMTGHVEKIRRLSLNLDGSVGDRVAGSVQLSQTRMLAIFGTSSYLPPFQLFKHLRVLTIEIAVRSEPALLLDLNEIHHLFQLRYLKIVARGCEVVLPGKIGSLQQLETFEINAIRKLSKGRSFLELPSDIIHLSQLLHLIVPKHVILPNGIGNMKSLRTLRCFNLDNSPNSIKGLRELTNLTYLEISGDGNKSTDDEVVEKCREVLRTCLEKLCNLNFLNMHCYRYKVYWDALSSTPASFCHLKRFTGRMFSRFPRWIGQLHDLYDLDITIKLVLQEDVGILAQLPSLIHLKLHIRGVPEDRTILIRGIGFPVLKLFTVACSKISYLAFEEGAMAKLQMLQLCFNAHGWDRYGAAPSGVEHLSSLKSISLFIGIAGARETNIKAAESVLRNTIDMHPGRPVTSIVHLPVIIFEDTPAATFEDKEEMSMR